MNAVKVKKLELLRIISNVFERIEKGSRGPSDYQGPKLLKLPLFFQVIECGLPKKKTFFSLLPVFLGLSASNPVKFLRELSSTLNCGVNIMDLFSRSLSFFRKNRKKLMESPGCKNGDDYCTKIELHLQNITNGILSTPQLEDIKEDVKRAGILEILPCLYREWKHRRRTIGLFYYTVQLLVAVFFRLRGDFVDECIASLEDDINHSIMTEVYSRGEVFDRELFIANTSLMIASTSRGGNSEEDSPVVAGIYKRTGKESGEKAVKTFFSNCLKFYATAQVGKLNHTTFILSISFEIFRSCSWKTRRSITKSWVKAGFLTQVINLLKGSEDTFADTFTSPQKAIAIYNILSCNNAILYESDEEVLTKFFRILEETTNPISIAIFCLIRKNGHHHRVLSTLSGKIDVVNKCSGFKTMMNLLENLDDLANFSTDLLLYCFCAFVSMCQMGIGGLEPKNFRFDTSEVFSRLVIFISVAMRSKFDLVLTRSVLVSGFGRLAWLLRCKPKLVSKNIHTLGPMFECIEEFIFIEDQSGNLAHYLDCYLCWFYFYGVKEIPRKMKKVKRKNGFVFSDIKPIFPHSNVGEKKKKFLAFLESILGSKKRHCELTKFLAFQIISAFQTKYLAYDFKPFKRKLRRFFNIAPHPALMICRWCESRENKGKAWRKCKNCKVVYLCSRECQEKTNHKCIQLFPPPCHPSKIVNE